MPGALFATFPRGALGMTTCAAWEGLWRGWIGVVRGELVADMVGVDKVKITIYTIKGIST